MNSNSHLPFVSIIIPTYNRKELLKRNLEFFKSQNYPSNKFEVIIVNDGNDPDISNIRENFNSFFSIKIINQKRSGAAQARNKGAESANGSILIFLDDDIEISPKFISSHVFAHENKANVVVIGNLSPIIHCNPSLFHNVLRYWWENMFEPMRQPGYRFSYRNLTSGNFSISREMFLRINGFNPTMKCQEDYELGIRLLQDGANFKFSNDAFGYHHEFTELEGTFLRKYNEGRASIQIGSNYPELINTLPFFNRYIYQKTFSDFLILSAVFHFGKIFDVFAYRLRYILRCIEWLKMRHLWLAFLDRGLSYWYLRGITDMLQDFSELRKFINNFPNEKPKTNTELKIDIKKGLLRAEKILDDLQPLSIVLFYGNTFVIRIPEKPGFERLNGCHLRPYIAYYMNSFINARFIESMRSQEESGEVPC